MPYRRLPNTDTARIKALKKALDIAKKYPPDMLAFKQGTLLKIQAFLPLFEQAIMMQKEAHSRQFSNSKEFTAVYKKAKLYISHFLQVFNFAVIRGEIKPSARKFFDIDEKNGRLPDLKTENEVVDWGKKVITGENNRVMKTGNPILSPKIAVVKVYYDEFVEKLNFQKMLQSISVRANTKVSEMRPECDEIICRLWNEVEEYYSKETPERKREQAARYGVTYVYRPSERVSVNNGISIAS
ncbi:MAG: hypothetical protein VZQ51_06085 [Bacteroidales bacterium]|nr:hypothetical protein [Bacteroidales bacterium]